MFCLVSQLYLYPLTQHHMFYILSHNITCSISSHTTSHVSVSSYLYCQHKYTEMPVHVKKQNTKTWWIDVSCEIKSASGRNTPPPFSPKKLYVRPLKHNPFQRKVKWNRGLNKWSNTTIIYCGNLVYRYHHILVYDMDWLGCCLTSSDKYFSYDIHDQNQITNESKHVRMWHWDVIFKLPQKRNMIIIFCI